MAFKMKGPWLKSALKQGKKTGSDKAKSNEATADPNFWKTAEDGSMVNKHYYVNKDSSEKEKTDAGWTKAEDGSYVPPNYYNKK